MGFEEGRLNLVTVERSGWLAADFRERQLKRDAISLLKIANGPKNGRRDSKCPNPRGEKYGAVDVRGKTGG